MSFTRLTLALPLVLLLGYSMLMPAAAPPRFLALGDSYTIGQSVTEPDRWPSQLARALREAGRPLADPQVVAKTGWTTDELSVAIDAAAPKGPFALVTLLIGVNDQYRGRDVEHYRGELARLLQRAVDFAGGEPRHVIVISIPDWGVTPFAGSRNRAHIAEEIDRFNAVAAEEARRVHARWIDITPVSRRSGATLVASDGLHPSREMYAEWTRLIAPEALAALR